MFDRKRYFNEIRESDEKIASNILTDRLNKLEKSGIIIKTKDIKHKQKNIYTLTKKGIDLMPIMIAMSSWSLNHRVVSEKDRIHVSELIKGGKALQDKMRTVLIKEFEAISENNDPLIKRTYIICMIEITLYQCIKNIGRLY